MKTTYLFGAGASRKAVPIIGELEKGFNWIANWLTHQEVEIAFTDTREKAKSHLRWAASGTRSFGTIDTYARKLSMTNTDELRQLKAILVFFMQVWQELPDKQFPGEANERINYQNIDTRYHALMANYLTKVGNRITLNKDVSFITWNFDTQLERSIGLFADRDLESVLANYDIFPYFPNDRNRRPQILHLNGIAGLYEDAQHGVKSIFEAAGKIDDKLKILLSFINEAAEKKIDLSRLLTFAWDSDPVSMAARKYSLEIIAETEILIIIGYSFPTFNDEIDKQLLQTVRGSENIKRIYYQNPNATREILTERFGFDDTLISIVRETDQFVMPLEAAAYSKLQKGWLM